MSHANLQKKLWATVCILSLFTLTVLWTEIADRSPRPDRGSNHSPKDGLQRLPDNVLNDESLLRKLRNMISCNNTFPLWLNKPKPSPKEPVYVITPTYPRALQIPELTRIGQTLKHVENLIWIVAEDAAHPTNQAPMPTKFRVKKANTWPKGVENRNKGIEWIIKHVQATGDDSGVFYFADDDNTYDIRLFEEIRKTKRLSLFPVGFLSEMPVSTPLLNASSGKLIEFYEGWIGKRSFPVDMAAFAVNVRHFIKLNMKKPVRMDYKRGYEEESFLKLLEVEPADVEFLADNCTKIYVWHTKTQIPSLKAYKKLDTDKLSSTNLGELLKYWCNFVDKQPCDFGSVEMMEQLNTTTTTSKALNQTDANSVDETKNVHGSSGNPVDIFVPDNNSKNKFVRDDNDDGVTNTNTSTKRRRQVIRKK